MKYQMNTLESYIIASITIERLCNKFNSIMLDKKFIAKLSNAVQTYQDSFQLILNTDIRLISYDLKLQKLSGRNKTFNVYFCEDNNPYGRVFNLILSYMMRNGLTIIESFSHCSEPEFQFWDFMSNEHASEIQLKNLMMYIDSVRI